MVGVVLRFSSVASCADTRGVRVESPIRSGHSLLSK